MIRSFEEATIDGRGQDGLDCKVLPKIQNLPSTNGHSQVRQYTFPTATQPVTRAPQVDDANDVIEMKISHGDQNLGKYDVVNKEKVKVVVEVELENPKCMLNGSFSESNDNTKPLQNIKNMATASKIIAHPSLGITATHQLESALKTLALAARSILQVLSREDSLISADSTVAYDGLVSGSLPMNVDKIVLLDALFKTLPGLDANDRPKLSATIQLYQSIISCVRELDNCHVRCPNVLKVDWSLWIDEFLSHHFRLLVNLEPSYRPFDADPDYGPTLESGYSCPYFLRLLFGKMAPPLYEQALNKVVKFVHGNMLPGNVDAIGDICSAAVYANPSMAFQQLLEPILQSLITALGEFPSAGFSGSGKQSVSIDSKVFLAPALVRTATYKLNILLKPLVFGGPIVPLYSEILDRVINATFDVPSTQTVISHGFEQINEAGAALLSS
eukprot:Gb_11033 [translate_table: standard]